MIVAFEEEPMEGSDDVEPDYAPAGCPSERFHSRDYTPARLELLNSNDGSDEDVEDQLDLSFSVQIMSQMRT